MNYYLYRGGDEVSGPVERTELERMWNNGSLDPSVLVCTEEGKWAPALTYFQAVRQNGRSPGVSWKRIVLASLAVAAILCLGNWRWPGRSERKPKPLPFRPAEIALFSEGIILQEHCKQGVNFDRFSSQLVRVKAVYREAEPGIEGGIRRSHFSAALSYWSLAHEAWGFEITENRPILYSFARKERELMDRLVDATALRPQRDANASSSDKDPKVFVIKPAVRMLLGKASDSFQDGLDDNRDAMAVDVREIDARRPWPPTITADRSH